MRSKVVLTGFMGTGKSVVGRQVAARLGREFYDTDQMIVARNGRSVARIFADDGEAQFRALEREVIAELAQDPAPTVIATGGGTLVDGDNFAKLAAVATIVCLTATPAVIAGRVAAARIERPLLTEAGLPAEQAIVQLMAKRAAAYARAAVTIDTSKLSIEQAAAAVIEALEG